MVLPQYPPSRPITAPPRKRQIPSCTQQTAEDALDHPSKRQKTDQLFPPARFWDSLSKIPLTRNALRELNKRSAKVPCGLAPRKRRRGRGADLFHQQAAQSLGDDLATYSKHIKHFARHGGPDLRDLRGVCECPCIISLMLTPSSTEL